MRYRVTVIDADGVTQTCHVYASSPAHARVRAEHQPRFIKRVVWPVQTWDIALARHPKAPHLDDASAQDALVSEHDHELAQRYGVSPVTVRVWRHRLTLRKRSHAFSLTMSIMAWLASTADGMTCTEICRKKGVSRQRVHQGITLLKEKGWIADHLVKDGRRRGPNKHRQVWTLTADGWGALWLDDPGLLDFSMYEQAQAEESQLVGDTIDFLRNIH